MSINMKGVNRRSKGQEAIKFPSVSYLGSYLGSWVAF